MTAQPEAAARADAQARRALARGIAFLEAAQLPSGEIPIDIAMRPDMGGPSHREPAVFPAALAARALAEVPAAARMVGRALDFLEREMHPDGLWRHPSTELRAWWHTPLDVDDTALASAALRAAGRAVPDNRALLLAEREPGGLFRTWIVRWWPHPLATWRFFRRIAERADVDCVINANAVFYLGDCEETRPVVADMLAILRERREMAATIWYASPFTIWYFFAHALRRVGLDAGDAILARLDGAAAPADALELAAATTTGLLWNRVPDVAPLLAAQRPSGAWPSCAFYHMGRRRDEAQPKAPWWGSEALTTVFAVEALSRYLDAAAP